MEFSEAVDFILAHEGGLVDDADDPGGLTNYGISQRAYPDVKIKDLTIEGAKYIYKRDYWDKCKADLLPPQLKYMHFDTAVNMGINRAAKLLQKSVKATPDGAIGPNTLKAVRDRASVRNYAVQRIYYYIKIIVNRPTSVKYARGWVGRVIDVIIVTKN